jgi:hypothetical protein
LIEKYDDHPLRQKRDIVLPVPSNQKYNAYLKTKKNKNNGKGDRK